MTKLDQTLYLLRSRYPTLSDLEIVKMCIGRTLRQEFEHQQSNAPASFFDSLPPSDLTDEEAMEVALKAERGIMGKIQTVILDTNVLFSALISPQVVTPADLLQQLI